MWKAFRNSAKRNAPQAAILFDKFHILRHLGEALDKVRKQEYALLSHKENLRPDARKGMKTLLAANKRLNTAYLLKESFSQLWEYNREPWARKPFEKFAKMMDRHGDGIALIANANANANAKIKWPQDSSKASTAEFESFTEGRTGYAMRNILG